MAHRESLKTSRFLLQNSKTMIVQKTEVACSRLSLRIIAGMCGPSHANGQGGSVLEPILSSCILSAKIAA
jgi:hypothetical protein